MRGAKHLSLKQHDELPQRIKEFLSLNQQLEDLKKKHAEFMGRLAHDLGEKKVAINFAGGKVLESDGRTTVKITDHDIEIVE